MQIERGFNRDVSYSKDSIWEMLASIFTTIILHEAFNVDKSQGALCKSFWGREKELWFVLAFNQSKPSDVLSVMIQVHLYRVPGERAHLICVEYYGAITYSIMQLVRFCWDHLHLALINIFCLCLELTVDKGKCQFISEGVIWNDI